MGSGGADSAGIFPIDGENDIISSSKDLDAGALFVLKSRGSWLHCGYHLTTAIVSAALLSLPFAFSLLGWSGGVVCLTMAGLVTFYSYNLLSLVLEHYAQLGKRHLRFRDMAHDILGPGWGRYFVGPLQLAICYGAVIASMLLGEQILKATIAPPTTGKMFKGLLVCYSVAISTFFSVAISGYWAFGNEAQGSVLANFMPNGMPILPKAFLLMTFVFTLVQISAVTLVYLQPTNVIIERRFVDPKLGQFSMRNAIPRLVFRSLTVIVATTLAAMLPFFGDIMALFGAFGCIPLDFILPMVFYNVTFKPSRRSLIFWGNTVIAVVSTVLAVVGAVASVRQIILDAKTYRLFANM
ncbi:hypothetical protein DH2020_034406 [Rehmannia glutinosa]|uniref:Amino acid transporter transmembrane domain-containing protein n=1 Tax=Rehmannia glutinosa TaxID=99300 RepID=A0ABR0VBA8_REHGL